MGTRGTILLRFRNMFITAFSQDDSYIEHGLGQNLLKQITQWLRENSLDLITMKMIDLYIKLNCLQNRNYEKSIKDEIKKIIPVDDVVDTILEYTSCPKDENYERICPDDDWCNINSIIQREYFYDYNCEYAQNIPLYPTNSLYDAALCDLDVLYYQYSDYVYILDFDNLTFYILYGVIRDLSISIDLQNIEFFENLTFIKQLAENENANQNNDHDFPIPSEITNKLQICRVYPMQQNLSMTKIRKLRNLYECFEDVKLSGTKQAIINGMNAKIRNFEFLRFEEYIQISVISPSNILIYMPLCHQFDFETLPKNNKYYQGWKHNDRWFQRKKIPLDHLQKIKAFIDI